ncbi:type VI secretion system Vgr family protein [Pseudoduganella ginsengisoli]|uniref:Type VI secretion system tip protein VgrG n=1 Tax=Pseudoduganella ginsengisoli TaxID=1462440 RepID=A0A6L6Q7D2_9BURK|nr:type VI secretion system Vgr family protein [Pseudoduganella ginsengisoli]MTW05426.1 type VI secretion system tip protein VgrG [Pseudoduganella ginsengisoli]
MASFSFSGLTQATRLLQLSTPIGADKLIPECVRGEEALDAGFSLTISALSTDAAIPLKSLLGQPALLQLLTASTDTLRPFHGHITAVELAASNGGLARYQLTLEPWTSFLAYGRDSRVFQDMTVPEILDAVFSAWRGRGKLAPAWRFDLLDISVYPRHSLVTQYQESDLAFVQRLMLEQGLFYFFDHAGDPDSPALGAHTLVIADHNGVFQPAGQPIVRFTQPGAVMKDDAMDRWRTELRLQTNAIELRSWDYRTLHSRPVNAGSGGASPLSHRDTLGQYAYASTAHGQRHADNLLAGLEARKEVHTGAGTVRTLSPGTIFTLHGQDQLDLADGDDARTFVVLRAVHLMHNNLDAQMQAAISARLPVGALASSIAKETSTGLHAAGLRIHERPLYRNRIEAIRSSIAYRPAPFGDDGEPRHQKPRVTGQQTAIVVGPPGSTIHTDRDHRVKVQFHWQRGKQSHSRLEHPDPDSHAGAPADDSAGTWVRVATPLAPIAGANWGSHALPRVGQEVLVDFLEGDIDRPTIIGALYNGKGHDNAQHNQHAAGAGASTGNAPAWFPGASAAHAHPAVLSGLKSQAMSASQEGTGAYSQLVFDDTAGRPRLALQRHGRQQQDASELNLGRQRHQDDNQSLEPAGLGAELHTTHSAALRAGQGILLSGDARRGASGSQLDAREAHAQLGQAVQLQASMAKTAQQHRAGVAASNGTPEPAPDQLPAIAAVAHSMKTIAGNDAGASAFREPQLQLSAPAGIAALTPGSAILSAAENSSITAGQDINMAAQGNHLQAVAGGISLFTYGKASGSKPVQETGIRLHAASGEASVQSQTGRTAITADKSVTVASVSGSVLAAAKEHVQLAAQGAFLKLEGGNIMLHGPGKIDFKASMKELGGPASASSDFPRMPVPESWPGVYSQQVNVANFIGVDETSGAAHVQMPYSIRDKSGTVIATGVTGDEGDTRRVFTKEKEAVDLFLGEGEWRVFVDVKHNFGPAGGDA